MSIQNEALKTRVAIIVLAAMICVLLPLSVTIAACDDYMLGEPEIVYDSLFVHTDSIERMPKREMVISVQGEAVRVTTSTTAVPATSESITIIHISLEPRWVVGK